MFDPTKILFEYKFPLKILPDATLSVDVMFAVGALMFVVATSVGAVMVDVAVNVPPVNEDRRIQTWRRTPHP